MSFATELKLYYENRGEYPCIKVDTVAQEFSVYIYGKPKKFFKSLLSAKAWYNQNKWDI